MKLTCSKFGNKNLIFFYFGTTACFAMTVRIMHFNPINIFDNFKPFGGNVVQVLLIEGHYNVFVEE